MKIEMSSVLNIHLLCICVLSEFLLFVNFKTFLLSLKIFTALHGEESDKVHNFKSEVQSLQLKSVYLDQLESQYISNQ